MRCTQTCILLDQRAVWILIVWLFNLVSPEAIPVGGSAIVLAGSRITLTAFDTSISGNTTPVVSWTGPDGLPRNTSGRFNTSVLGQMTIMNIIQDDNGTYTCVISNGIGQVLSETVDIIVAGLWNEVVDKIS